jgi:hypothetical protein
VEQQQGMIEEEDVEQEQSRRQEEREHDAQPQDANRSRSSNHEAADILEEDEEEEDHFDCEANTKGDQNSGHDEKDDPDRKNDDDNDDNNDVDDDDDETNGTTICGICLGPYQVGDIVAWSYNPQCPHAYHASCITDWLQTATKDSLFWCQGDGTPRTCPSCRHEYVVGQPTVTNVTTNTTTTMPGSDEAAENDAPKRGEDRCNETDHLSLDASNQVVHPRATMGNDDTV